MGFSTWKPAGAGQMGGPSFRSVSFGGSRPFASALNYMKIATVTRSATYIWEECSIAPSPRYKARYLTGSGSSLSRPFRSIYYGAAPRFIYQSTLSHLLFWAGHAF